MHDDAFYVPPELLAAWRERDPIALLRARLLAARRDLRRGRRRGPAQRGRPRGRRGRRARAAPASGPIRRRSPTASTADPRRRARERDRGPDYDDDSEGPVAVRTYLEAISDGLREEMRRDDRVFVIGEDVGVYGGAFKVTKGFQEEFGEWRVIDAPLAETAIVGACTGAAMMGLRPVAEMQFADFISCCWDHLVTIAAKQHWRTGASVPIVVRCPSGGGFSGGPFHSQNPESSFAHIPGLKIVCPSTPGRCQGPADRVDPRRQPGALLRAQAPLPAHQGRGARGRLHRAVRRRARRARGRRPHARDLGRDGAHGLRRGRPGRRRARHLDRGHRPAHDRARGIARPCWPRSRAPARRSSCTRTRAPQVSVPRSRPRSARRSSRTSTPPSCALAAPDTPVPFSPPLEQRFIPQVDDVLAAVHKLYAY